MKHLIAALLSAGLVLPAQAACSTFNTASIDLPFEVQVTNNGVVTNSEAGDSITTLNPTTGAQTNKITALTGTASAATTGPVSLLSIGLYNTVYASEYGQTIYMVDNTTGAAIWSLPFIPAGSIVGTARFGNVGYVLVSPSVSINAYVQRFNVYDGTLIGSPLAVPGITARGLQVSADGSRIYFVTETPSRLYVIDTRRWRTLTSYPLGNTPRYFMLSKDEAYGFASNYGDGTVSQVKFADGSVTPIAAGASGDQPRRMTTDGTYLYVTFQAGAKIVKVLIGDPAGTPSSIVGTNTASGPLFGVALSADGSKLFAAQQGTAAVLSCPVSGF